MIFRRLIQLSELVMPGFIFYIAFRNYYESTQDQKENEIEKKAERVSALKSSQIDFRQSLVSGSMVGNNTAMMASFARNRKLKKHGEG